MKGCVMDMVSQMREMSAAEWMLAASVGVPGSQVEARSAMKCGIEAGTEAEAGEALLHRLYSAAGLDAGKEVERWHCEAA